MPQAHIDSNDVKTRLAYNATTSLVEPIRCDAVLDYLEIFNMGTTSGTFTAIPNAKIDQNEVKTLLAYNETTGLVECCRCDDNGNLIVKFV
jgi:hypothetical protein